MMNRPPSRFYLFDGFRVDVSERILFKGNREVPLTPKVFDTLLVLLENSSHVLTKKELMQQVWPDSFVEENNLAQNISILRKALGKGKEGEHYIQTVPKRGYRFVADVTSTGGEEESVIVHERTRARFRGREIDLMENRLLAIFDGPARAIRCASTITEYCSRLGVKTCTGLHTGECEIVDGQVAGAAAQVCVCVANEAEAGEVLVSSTVKDLVAGSGINFEDRGVHMLSGCGESRLFAVQRSA
jgi:DNA-binding winged helix-turn-helix (wHTH) protein